MVLPVIAALIEPLVAAGVRYAVAQSMSELAEQAAGVEIDGTSIKLSVSSSFITNIEWNAVSTVMTVSMRSGEYQYPGTGFSTVAAFMSAPSKGTYYNDNIKVSDGGHSSSSSSGLSALAKAYGSRALR